MGGVLHRFVENVLLRLDGPFHFRFTVQPLMAAFIAVIDGLRDAREGKAPFLWAAFADRNHRRELLADGWRRVGRIFILAIILDIAYKWRVDHGIFPGETLFVAFALALVPYALVRGPVNRIASFWLSPDRRMRTSTGAGRGGVAPDRTNRDTNEEHAP